MTKQKFGWDEPGSPDTRPFFYITISPHDTMNMRIPSDFKDVHLRNVETGYAKIWTTSGNWDVKLLKDNNDIHFTLGWREFVNDHFLGDFEFLAFHYNGDLSFDVEIFEENGHKRSYQSVGTSQQENEVEACFPFFKKKMTDSNVGSNRSCSLPIPQSFARSYLPPTKQKITLRNSDGNSWSAKIILSGDQHLSICGGWKAFVVDNSIERGDTCIFELVAEKTMQVHIRKGISN